MKPTRTKIKFDEAQILEVLGRRGHKLKELLEALGGTDDTSGYASGDLSEQLQKLKHQGKVRLLSAGYGNITAVGGQVGTVWALSGKKQFTIEMDNTLLANAELTILLQKHNGKVL